MDDRDRNAAEKAERMAAALRENLRRRKAQVEAAGFRLVGESTVLRNPADDHSKAVFDPEIRGKTDQFVYKFRKP